MTRRKKRNQRWTFVIILLILIAGGVYLYNKFILPRLKPDRGVVIDSDVIDKTIVNYGGEVSAFASQYKLPASYFLALIVLESSGRQVIPPRFEPHVYDKLKEVKQGKRKSYEHVTPSHIKDATDDALKNLASSWGPFQLMGYKCLLLDIKIKDIRGKDAIFWGIHWINLTYGKELKAGNYKDAFHIHNTGRKYPRHGRPYTHDPNYVQRGLGYMKQFEDRIAEVQLKN